MTQMTSPARSPTPYATAAVAYREHGWLGVLPLPPKSKRLAVVGYTGHDGEWPSFPDVYTWAECQPSGNVALRLPENVIGIDVDAYKDSGATTFGKWEAEHGILPPTWRCTARSDGVSGIRLYRIPAGLGWLGQLSGGGVETVHFGHRYVMAPPSIHPDLGVAVRWIDPAGNTTAHAYPHPEDLPELPSSWVDALSIGPFVETPTVAMDSTAAWEWVASLPHASDPACELMRGESVRSIARLRASDTRHDQMKRDVLKLLRLATEGHAGVATELTALRSEFLGAVTRSGPNQRTLPAAQSEWQRAFDGGAAKVRGNTAEIWPRCYCAGPFNAQLLRDSRRQREVALLQAGESADSSGDRQSDNTYSGGYDSSWLPGEWSLALAGKLAGQPPAELRRLDGARLWYAGRINGLIGPSESGKSWVALLAVIQAVNEGKRVIILDFEDTMIGTAERLRALGGSVDRLVELVTYIAPREDLDQRSAQAFWALVARITPALVIVDGVNAAMTLMGLDLLDNKDVTRFYLRLLRPLEQSGATVGYVDHTPKNDTERVSKGGIGAQAKRAMTTGASIAVEVISYFDRSHPGKLKLTVDKDRTGHVRHASVKGVIGIVDAVPDGAGALSLSIRAPYDDGNGADVDPMMKRVAEVLDMLGEPGVREVQREIDARPVSVQQALRRLIEQGYVEVYDGSNRKVHHRLIRSYPQGVSRVSERIPETPGSGVSLPSGGDTTRSTLENDLDRIHLWEPGSPDDPGSEA